MTRKISDIKWVSAPEPHHLRENIPKRRATWVWCSPIMRGRVPDFRMALPGPNCVLIWWIRKSKKGRPSGPPLPFSTTQVRH